VHLISYQPAISVGRNPQRESDGPKLSGVDSSSGQFPTELTKDTISTKHPLEKKSSPNLLFVTVEAWTVDIVHNGIFD